MLSQYHQTKKAVGSDVTLVLVADETETRVDDFFNELWSQIYKFERRFSRFIPASELSLFNRSGGKQTAISPSFRKLLLASKSMSELTNGLYNPFILPALQRAGYTHSFLPGHEDETHDDYSNRNVVLADQLEVGDDWAKIPFNTSLDMGGCGKGYLADQLASDIPDFIKGFWFSLGGDIIAGGHNELNKPWTVHIADTINLEGQRPFVFQPNNFDTFAVATSGTTIRRGVNAKNTKWHHIIDPRTQQPSTSDLRLASVYSKNAINADVLASSAIIVGSSDAKEFLEKRGVQAGLLQQTSGKEIAFGNTLQSIVLKKERSHS